MQAARQEAVTDRPDIMALLRCQTAADHERMHRLPLFMKLETGMIDRDEYCLLLVGMAGFYTRFDHIAQIGCASFGTITAPYAYTPRAPLIAGEIASIAGHSIRDETGTEWGLAAPNSAASLAGMLYVVDGAMLGGSLLSRQCARFGLADDGYWHWCRQQAGAQWRGTRMLLHKVARGFDEADQVVEGARSAFAAFGVSMDCAALACDRLAAAR